ncbi:hypothetical protein HanOQP8_Chr17g0669571 [Helianthus annuus]|nr:hypothetical protein HanOQP8_Chr17g0669571 [Helianthus annuus]
MLLLRWLLLWLLLHHSVRADICEVVWITTCKAGSCVSSGSWSCLLTLRSGNRSWQCRSLSLSLTRTSTAVSGKVPIKVAVDTKSSCDPNRMMISTSRAQRVQTSVCTFRRRCIGHGCGYLAVLVLGLGRDNIERCGCDNTVLVVVVALALAA